MADNESNKKALADPERADADELGKVHAEIDAAVGVATERLAKGETGMPKGDEPKGEDVAEDLDDATPPPAAEADPEDEKAGSSGDGSRDDKGRFVKPVPLSDALLERAVRAGIPLAEAKQHSEALLTATCGRIEGVQNKSGEGKPAGAKEGGGEAKPAKDPLDAIPDLDPAVYDEKIVAGFKALKGVAKALREENATLRGEKSKDFMATQLEGVKELTKGDVSKETAVREKFDVLRAGYKAASKDVSDVTIFKEASQLVLGADAEALKNKKSADAAGKRSGQRISRPSGQRVEVKPDVASETAEMLDRKYFAKS